MEATTQVNDTIRIDTLQAAEPQVVTETTVTVPATTRDKSKDVASAIEVTGISMVAIFGFMGVFYLVIKAIDRYFPDKSVK